MNKHLFGVQSFYNILDHWFSPYLCLRKDTCKDIFKRHCSERNTFIHMLRKFYYLFKDAITIQTVLPFLLVGRHV